MKNQAVIVAAGKGTRFKTSLPKPLVLLNGKPLLVYSLESFQDCPLIDSIVVVAPQDYLSEFKSIIETFRFTKVAKTTEGGEKRRDSVYCGLKVLDGDTDFVVIHDGVRPFVTTKIIEHAILAAHKDMAAIVAVPVTSTIKTIHPTSMTIDKTLNRDTLWEVQTPQVFKKDIILRAHRELKDDDPTDDALLVEKLGLKIKVVMGDYKNIKLTTENDLSFAEALLTLQGTPT